MDDGTGATGRSHRFAPLARQNSRECQVHAFQRAEDAGVQGGRRVAQRVDQFVGAFVALPPLADTAIDDLFQMIAARERSHLIGTEARTRIALYQHAKQLPDLIDVVSRLPLGRGTVEDVARRRHGVQGSRGDAAGIALLTGDPEITELEPATVAHEDIERSEVAVQRLSPMELSEDIEDPGDLPPRRRFTPSFAVAAEERSQIAVTRVFERQTIQHAFAAAAVQWGRGETRRTHGWRVDDRPGAARNTPRAANCRCAG